MLRFLVGLFVLLHGLVHLWFVVLSRQWVPFEPEMGWTGKSWLFSGLIGDPATRWVATVAYALATLTFSLGGIGLILGTGWWRPLVIGSSVLSAVLIVLFWDGGMRYIVPKGLIGFLIDGAILISLLIFGWPPTQV